MNYILIAHDPSIMRCGLSQIVSLLPAPVTVLMVTTTADVMAAMKKQSFDLLIINRHIAGMDPLMMVNMVRTKYAATRVLLFSDREERAVMVDQLYQEADAYLCAASTEEEMALTLATLLRTDTGTKALSLYPSTPFNPLTQLSSREIEVMNLLAKGLPLQKIAAKMELQLTTVSTYKTRIFKKLGINSIVELLDIISIYGARKVG